MFRKLCGDAVMRNVVLVINMWSKLSSDAGEAREKELSSRFFRPALENGAQMVRYHNTVQSAHDIIQRIVQNRPAALQIQRELVDEKKDIINTVAGEAINRELNEQMRRHQAELEEVHEEMVQALRAKDKETIRELAEVRKKLRERMEETVKDSEGMTSSYAVEKQRVEAVVEEVEEMELQAKREKERVELERIRPRPNPPRTRVTDLTDDRPRPLLTPSQIPSLQVPLISYV